MAAPLYRATGTVVVSANNVANPTNLAPTKSGSTVNGDLMVCFAVCRSITATVATPTGWTLYSSHPRRSATASGGSIYTFYRIADGTANDAPTIAWSGVTTGTSGDSSSAVILSYYSAGGGESATVATTDAAATTSWSIPSVTTLTAEAVQLSCSIKVSDTAQTSTVSFPHTERVDNHTTTGTGHMLSVSDRFTGATGATGAATLTPSNTTSSRVLAASVAFAPTTNTADNGNGPAYDARTAATFGTGPLSWTHNTGGGTIKGVMVQIVENSGANGISQEVTGVTYGGSALSQVTGSPQTAISNTEDAIVHTWFLGSSVPAGASKTVSVSQSGATNNKAATSITFTNPSGLDTRIANTTAAEKPTSGGDQQFGGILNAGTLGSVVMGVAQSTSSNPATELAPGQAYTEMSEIDFGSQSATFVRRTTEGATGLIPVNWIHSGPSGEGWGYILSAVEGVPPEIPLQQSALVSDSSTTVPLTAKTGIPLQTSAMVSNAPNVAATATTQIPLGTSALLTAATAALKAQTTITLQSSDLLTNASIAITLPAGLVLQTSAIQTAATGAFTAKTGIPLQTSALQSAATASLTAQTQIALQAAALQTNASAALTAKTLIALGTSALVSNTSNLPIIIPAFVPLQTSALQTSAGGVTLVVRSIIPLQTSALQTSASAAFTAKTGIPLGTSALQTSASAAFTAKTGIPLQTSTLQTAATASFQVAVILGLQQSDIVSSASAALSARALMVLGTATLNLDAGNVHIHVPGMKSRQMVTTLALATLLTDLPLRDEGSGDPSRLDPLAGSLEVEN